MSFGLVERFFGNKVVVLVALLIGCTVIAPMQRPVDAADNLGDTNALVDAFRHVEVASISDALEQLLHEKRFMSHNMRPIAPTRFAGLALTVKLVKQEHADSAALNGMLEAIDKGGPGSVYVM